jgi:hypothetical protein
MADHFAGTGPRHHTIGFACQALVDKLLGVVNVAHRIILAVYLPV